MKRALMLVGGLATVVCGLLLGSACEGEFGPDPCGDLAPIELRSDVYEVTSAPRDDVVGGTVDVDLETRVTISYVDENNENWVITYEPI